MSFLLSVVLASNENEQTNNNNQNLRRLLYLPCDNSRAQLEYLAHEREVFGVPEALDHLNISVSTGNTNAASEPIAMTCITPEGKIERAESFVMFTKRNTNRRSLPSVRYPVPSFVLGAGEYLIEQTMRFIAGWETVVVDGETFLYKPNPTTSNKLFHFHGIGASGGLESLWLLRDATRTSAVYLAMFPSVNFIETQTGYRNNVPDHIKTVARFIREQTDDRNGIYRLSGHSLGTVRLTALCKFDPELCLRMTDIIFLDPISINLPYSRIAWLLTYGMFFEHPELTRLAQSDPIIALLRTEHYFDVLYRDLDWYDWSIDSRFIVMFQKQLVLTIGTSDNLVDAMHVPLLDLCRTSYIGTPHAFVLLGNLVDWMSQNEKPDFVGDSLVEVA